MPAALKRKESSTQSTLETETTILSLHFLQVKSYQVNLKKQRSMFVGHQQQQKFTCTLTDSHIPS